MKKILITGLLSVALLASCGEKEESNQTTSDSSAFETQTGNITLSDTSVTVAGVTFRPPSDWNDEGPSGMRQAEYSMDPIDDETEFASMAVYYFGQNQGGTVQANIDRWIGQIKTDQSPEPVQKEATIAGMKVTTIEVTGTYSSSMGGPMSGQTTAYENFKLFGAVVEGPEGSVFFKLTGPDKTATAMTKEFMAMIQDIKSQ